MFTSTSIVKKKKVFVYYPLSLWMFALSVSVCLSVCLSVYLSPFSPSPSLPSSSSFPSLRTLQFPLKLFLSPLPLSSLISLILSISFLHLTETKPKHSELSITRPFFLLVFTKILPFKRIRCRTLVAPSVKHPILRHTYARVRAAPFRGL